MIERDHELPLARQAAALGISRGSLYYAPRPVSAADLAVMRRIDELHLDYPFAGSRMLRDLLRGEGIAIGRDRVTTMMRRMSIEAVYRWPNTSKPTVGHKIYPYLLRGLTIDRANQVWCMDITYIPMARGFVYLAVVLDWFSRRVLSWRVSITMEVDFCLEAVEEALARHGKPSIFNTDQGEAAQGSVREAGGMADEGASSPVRRSPACCCATRSRLAWTGAVLGATTCSLNGSGARSNTRRSICGHTKASAMRGLRSAGIWDSIISSGRIRVWMAARPIKPISMRCRWQWQHERRRRCGHHSGRATPSLRDAHNGSPWEQPAEDPLIGNVTLFRQTQPPL